MGVVSPTFSGPDLTGIFHGESMAEPRDMEHAEAVQAARELCRSDYQTQIVLGTKSIVGSDIDQSRRKSHHAERIKLLMCLTDARIPYTVGYGIGGRKLLFFGSTECALVKRLENDPLFAERKRELIDEVYSGELQKDVARVFDILA